MKIKTPTLLLFDRFFFPLQRALELIFDKLIPISSQQTKHVILIKLVGKGSIIHFVNRCRQLGVAQNSFTLVTFESQRDICEWMKLKNVIFIRTKNIFHFVIDVFKVMRYVKNISPHTVISLERCSYAVNAFSLMLSIKARCKNILFEPARNKLSEKHKVYAVGQLTLEGLFNKCIVELPAGKRENNSQETAVVANKIIVNVNASDLLLARRYSLDQFAEVIRQLHQYDPKLQFILTGSNQEYDYVQLLVNQLNGVPISNVGGKWSLQKFSEELATSALLITVDSMPLHMAAFLEIPVVVLWGPTQAEHFGYAHVKNIHSVSLNLSCSPCYIHPASKAAAFCNGRIDCMTTLKPSVISELCIGLLKNISAMRIVNFPSSVI